MKSVLLRWNAVLLPLLMCAAAAAAQDHADPVRLRVLGGQVAPPATLPPGVEIASPGGEADLIWDAAEGVVFSASGEIAAERIPPDGVAAVAGKWAAARRLAALADQAPLALELAPPGEHRTFGETVRFRSGVLPHPHLVVFNLAANGDVQLLYPVKGDARAVPPGSRYELPLAVGPPAGADHLAVVNAEAPLDELLATLERGDSQAAAQAVAAALAPTKHRIGLLVLFSAPKP